MIANTPANIQEQLIANTVARIEAFVSKRSASRHDVCQELGLNEVDFSLAQQEPTAGFVSFYHPTHSKMWVRKATWAR